MQRSLLVLISTGLMLGFGAHASAEEGTDPYLTAGFEALEDGDFELGRDLLEKAAAQSDDPRIPYYRAYANEKVGNCDAARRFYRQAASNGPASLKEAGAKALEGFSERCVPAKPKTVEEPRQARPIRRSPTAVTLGWVSMTIGGMALLAIPVKHAFEQEVAGRTEDYFFQVYGCDVDNGELGAGCDEAEVKANEEWSTYERRIDTAKKSTVWMAAGGTAFMVVGLTAVILGSQRVRVAAAPTTDGVMASATLRF